jgi:hypothetical protein
VEAGFGRSRPFGQVSGSLQAFLLDSIRVYLDSDAKGYSAAEGEGRIF